MHRKALILLGICCAVALSACSRNNEPRLLNVKANQEGPDEFLVLPAKPLELPENYAGLPEPTPGGANRTDPDPEGDAAVALGGNPAGGVNDTGLVAYAGRFGVAPGIRGQLAKEDLEFRRANDGRVLERLFNVNVYFRAYKAQQLDQ